MFVILFNTCKYTSYSPKIQKKERQKKSLKKKSQLFGG